MGIHVGVSCNLFIRVRPNMSDPTYTPDALPDSIKKNLYVHYRISGYFAGQIDVFDFCMEDDERILLCETSVVIKIPRINRDGIRSKALDALHVQKNKILAENHAKLKVVQDKIDSLLALEYQPEEVA